MIFPFQLINENKLQMMFFLVFKITLPKHGQYHIKFNILLYKRTDLSNIKLTEMMLNKFLDREIE